MVKLHEPVTGKAEVDAVQKVLESGWLAEGEQTRKFEGCVSKYVGAKFAVAVSNCTVALELCLRALNITGEVVIPSFGHPATIRAVINADCIPKFLDVELESYNVNVNQIVMGGYFGIPISWGGNPLELDVMWGDSNKLIEDSACSLGTDLQFNYPKCFSFHPRKLITTGEGGIITTNNKELAETLRDLKNFGYSNYKFDDIRASIGIEQMKRLEGIIEERIRKAEVYEELLTHLPLTPPQKHDKARHTYQTYAVYLHKGNRDRIIKKLKLKGIETQIGAYALHRLPQFRDFGRVGSLRNSELLHQRLLALPMAHSLTEEDQQYVVECLKGELS